MSDELRIYNSLGRETQTFQPLTDGKVNMYVCGVTVYDDCHVGHGRVYVTFDVVRRFLEHEGYDVNYVVNFTDLEDKIINRARELGEEITAITERYTQAYFDVMDQLNIRRADVHPTVTGHIPEIIEHVQGLIDRDMAYEVEGNVYYDVSEFEDYGKLYGQDPEEMESGSRVDVDERKKSPLDFALWKDSDEDEPSWESPWGEGRPGWHIECSVMSRTHLGDTLDIHGGGRDLIFPHHENEIAQTEGLTESPFSRYWMHNGFVTIDDEKMSKSEGNFYTLEEVFGKFNPEVIRYFYLTRHYRSPLNFSFDRIREAGEAFGALTRFRRRLLEAEGWASGGEKSGPDAPDLDSHRRAFLDSMREDFNTAEALGHVQNWMGEWNEVLNQWERKDALHRSEHEAITQARDWLRISLEDILGLDFDGQSESGAGDGDTEALMDLLVSLRDRAREQENYEMSDEIRDRLQDLGYKLEDSPRGTRWDREHE
ncbi:MAG: cysteine--tRNA ligase [bacterium]